MQNLFKGPLILLAYLVGGLSIASGLEQFDFMLIGGLVFLLIWDLLYFFHPDSFKFRTIAGTNDSVTRARTYISWFIGLYGVVIGILLSQGDGANQIATALATPGTPIWLIALPLILSIVVMLFIPLQLGVDANAESTTPNTALKLLFFLVIYGQKVILILIGNVGLRVLTAWGV